MLFPSMLLFPELCLVMCRRSDEVIIVIMSVCHTADWLDEHVQFCSTAFFVALLPAWVTASGLDVGMHGPIVVFALTMM